MINFRSQPFAHTFSIVARDTVTGQMGVAVQSHWFSVGSVVPWAQAGIGAIATQSLTDISYGPLGLDLLRGGKTAQQALDALLVAEITRKCVRWRWSTRREMLPLIPGSAVSHLQVMCWETVLALRQI